MDASIVDQIDFNQLGKSEAGIQLPSYDGKSRKRAYSDSSYCDRSSQLPITLDSFDVQRSSEKDKARNLKPLLGNKNVSNIGQTFDHLSYVWKKENKYDHSSRVE